jgi:hypothetical protein
MSKLLKILIFWRIFKIKETLSNILRLININFPNNRKKTKKESKYKHKENKLNSKCRSKSLNKMVKQIQRKTPLKLKSIKK